MKEKLESIKKRYEEVTNELMQPEVMSDFQKLKTYLEEEL